jgi:hypothetical protein
MKIECTVSEWCELMRGILGTPQISQDVLMETMRIADIEIISPSPVDNSEMPPQQVGDGKSIMLVDVETGEEVTMHEYNRRMYERKSRCI